MVIEDSPYWMNLVASLDRDALKDRYLRLVEACINSEHRDDQLLGKCLGYPYYCDDQENFPGTTKEDGVCTGEHVASTLILEAIDEIEKLRLEVKRLKYLEEQLIELRVLSSGQNRPS